MHIESKSRLKDTAKKINKTNKNDKRMTQSANRYTTDVSATRTGITDSNKRINKNLEYKSNKRSAN
jgi:hypothetical protein